MQINIHLKLNKMETIEAHVFQHHYTGIQIFVYHVTNKSEATTKIYESGINANNYTYLGIKQVLR